MADNLIVEIGRTLARPWKEEISPTTAVVVVILFAIVVWWSLDSLRMFEKMHNFINEGIS